VIGPADSPVMRAEWLAEVVVTRAGGVFRGTGYRLTPSTLLTARHVVDEAQTIEVRFEADTPSACTLTATVAFEDAQHDLAVLTWPAAAVGPDVPTPLGRVGRSAVVVEVHVAGFPRWKIRQAGAADRDRKPRFRVAAHEPGTAAVLANQREGTLQITVAPPAVDPEPEVSPWEGMSGGPVFVDGRLVAVISRHHRREGLNRLTAAPVEGWLDRLTGEDQRKLLAMLGLRSAADLLDVGPGPAASLVRAAYLAQVRDIAPASGLRDRGAELDELTRFCAGEESYRWLQAGPWAGKTALLSMFALYPPAGVRVVSFFITRRLAGQTDSTAFTDALLDQLAALLGQQLPALSGPSARDAYRRELLRQAAARLESAGERLVVVVDGLDEDSGTAPESLVPSIASLLPRHLDYGMKIIVAGRPHPPIPADVPADHPLRTCPVRLLDPSPWARDLAREAGLELNRLLATGGLARDMVGLIAASGGGLTVDDLEALTGHPRYEVEGLLDGVLGRTVQRRAMSVDARPVYLFAHDTLRDEAVDRIGKVEFGRHRAAVHEWAGVYEAAGWPEGTPDYILRGYFALLRAAGDASRMLTLATDSDRHDRMLAQTGADGAALAEIATVEELLAGGEDVDLSAIARLAVHRDLLVHRNHNITADIPVLWGRLGYLERAEALAISIADIGERAEAFAELALITAPQDLGKAVALIRFVPLVARQAGTLATVAAGAAGSGDAVSAHRLFDDATQLADSLPSSAERVDALTGVFHKAVEAVDMRWLRGALRTITTPTVLAETLTAVAPTISAHWSVVDADEVLAYGRAVIEAAPESDLRTAALHLLDAESTKDAPAPSRYAEDLPLGPYEEPHEEPHEEPGEERGWDTESAVAVRRPDFAARTPPEEADEPDPNFEKALADALAAGNLNQAERIALSAGYDERLERLIQVARSAAGTGRPDYAERLLERAMAEAKPKRLWWWDDTGQLVQHLEAILTAAVAVGGPNVVQRLLDDCLADSYSHIPHALVEAACRAGLWEWAHAASATLSNLTARDLAWAALSKEAGAAGQLNQATAAAHSVSASPTADEAFDKLISAALRHHDLECAETAAGELAKPQHRVRRLSDVAHAAADVGDHKRAQALAEAAEATARAIPNPTWQVDFLRDVARPTAAAGDLDATRQLLDLAGAITAAESAPTNRAEPLLEIVHAVAAAGDASRVRILGAAASKVARSVVNADAHGEATLAVARSEGDPVRVRVLLEAADRIIRALPNPDRRAWALAELAWTAAAAGDFDRAEAAAAAIDNPDRRADTEVDLVRAMAAAGELRRAGDLAWRVSIPDRRADALIEVVRSMSGAGHFEQALTVAWTIRIPEARSEALMLLAWAAAKAGATHFAQDVAADIPDEVRRRWATDSVQAEIRARATAHPRPDGKPPAPDAPTESTDEPAAQSEDLRRLWQLARRMGDPAHQAELRRAAALAFRTTGSRPPLEPLAHLYPEIVTTVARETLALFRRRPAAYPGRSSRAANKEP